MPLEFTFVGGISVIILRDNIELPIFTGAIGISVGNQATVMLVWGLILERIFTL